MSKRVSVIALPDLRRLTTAKFSFEEAGNPKEGFVVFHNDEVYAYRNECRHIPVTLDWVENRFLSRDGCYIQCATHGALYEIASGHCVDGPPAGERLRTLPVTVENNEVLVEVPTR